MFITEIISLIIESIHINNKKLVISINTSKEGPSFYVNIENNGTIPIENIHLSLKDEYCIKLINKIIDINKLEIGEKTKKQFGIDCRPLSAKSPTSVVIDIKYTYRKWFFKKSKSYTRIFEF